MVVVVFFQKNIKTIILRTTKKCKVRISEQAECYVKCYVLKEIFACCLIVQFLPQYFCLHFQPRAVVKSSKSSRHSAAVSVVEHWFI